MTLILFCKIVYILSCMGMLWPVIDWHKEEGYVSLETIIWGIFFMFVPCVNTIVFWLWFLENAPFEKIFTYKIWEKK